MIEEANAAWAESQSLVNIGSDSLSMAEAVSPGISVCEDDIGLTQEWVGLSCCQWSPSAGRAVGSPRAEVAFTSGSNGFDEKEIHSISNVVNIRRLEDIVNVCGILKSDDWVTHSVGEVGQCGV